MCLLTVVFGLLLQRFFFDFLVPDLLNPVVFFKTRTPQPCSPASSAPAVGSTCHVDRRRPARGLHAPERPLLFGAREGHAPPFSGRAPWGRGLWWRIYDWVLLWRRVSPTRRCLRWKTPLSPLPVALFFGFFYFVLL
jgi:hypothetical protein